MTKTFPYRILVVDDEEAVLATTAAILRDAGYEVNTARDGFEALAGLRGSVPEVVITDLQMPGMSGFELLGVIRKRFPSVVVIATSGRFTPVSLPEGVLADRFLAKGNIPPMELLETVRELISQAPLRSQPARTDSAPAWVPRAGGYVVLTCPTCLRSFSLPSNGIAIGKRASETCMHCGAEVAYFLDASVVADRPSLLDTAQKRIETYKKTVESSRQRIDESRGLIRDPHRKES